jgi:hypothetical protein
MIQRTRRLSALALLATLVGCAGNGEGLDENGRPLTPGSASTVLTADFNSIQDHVFTPICSVCHSGPSAPRGLRLDAGNSYALLVGVNSNQVPGLQRVQAGNADASYLLQKITGTAAVGQRMPLGGPYLPPATIDVIRQWITNGAQRPTSVINTSLHVETTAPMSNEITTVLPQMVIGFNRELDVNLVNETTVVIENIETRATVAANLIVPTVNPSMLLITPYSTLANGTYRLTLRGSGGGALAGLDGQPLNAELNAATKSATGQDYTTTFTITVQP